MPPVNVDVGLCLYYATLTDYTPLNVIRNNYIGIAPRTNNVRNCQLAKVSRLARQMQALDAPAVCQKPAGNKTLFRENFT